MTPDHAAVEYAVALMLTLAIEAPIAAAVLRRWYRVPLWRGTTAAIVASMLTHPVVWFVLPLWLTPSVGYLGYLVVAESFAWLAEAAVYWLMTRRDPPGMLLLSLLANLASFTIGAILQATGLWQILVT
jgi:hypothetical protein